jgi:hypothetical protein
LRIDPASSQAPSIESSKKSTRRLFVGLQNGRAPASWIPLAARTSKRESTALPERMR